MRPLFWLVLLLLSTKLTVDHFSWSNSNAAVAQPARKQYVQLNIPAPAPRDIYLIEASPADLKRDAKLSTVPMVILYYRPNEKSSQLQEAQIQSVARGWLTHLRFYRVNVSAHGIDCPTPTVHFVQPDSTGYPVLLNQSSKLMDRTQTHAFMSAGMKQVQSTAFKAQQAHLAEITADQIDEIVTINNCPAVVLFLEDNSFLGAIAEQILLEGVKKYNHRAMFFRCTQELVPNFVPGSWPSTFTFILKSGSGKDKGSPVPKISCDSAFGFLERTNMEKLLKKLPPASPNNP